MCVLPKWPHGVYFGQLKAQIACIFKHYLEKNASLMHEIAIYTDLMLDASDVRLLAAMQADAKAKAKAKATHHALGGRVHVSASHIIRCDHVSASGLALRSQ
jgi:hypothetical protein